MYLCHALESNQHVIDIQEEVHQRPILEPPSVDVAVKLKYGKLVFNINESKHLYHYLRDLF